MNLFPIWQRYLFINLLKSFLLFLFCFFLLYTLIDFSTHSQEFIKNEKIDFSKLLIYYTYQFIKRLPLLLPLSLLISTIKVLSAFNSHRELLALQASGVNIKRILKPFFFLAFLCTLTTYTNEELFLPKTMAYLDQIRKPNELNLLKKPPKKQFNAFVLADSSKLIYQRFEQEKNVFFDVYWVRSFHDIWRMKYLSADPKNPIGEYVDHITRDSEGRLQKVESYEKCRLPLLKWEIKELNKKQSTIKHQKISTLALVLLKKDPNSFHLQGEVKTHLFYKLAIPLLPFLVLFGVLPHCISYSRKSPIFLVYGISIFSFVVLFTLIHAMIIIGENQTIPPYAAIFTPLLLSFITIYPKYLKKTG